MHCNSERFISHLSIAAATVVVLVCTTGGARAFYSGDKAPELVKCASSPLTENKFLDIVYAIAMHGDLTDVASTENALLKSRFHYWPEHRLVKDLNSLSRGYAAENILKTWISVTNSVSFNESEYAKYKEPTIDREGMILFQGLEKPDINLTDCASLKSDDVSKRFGRDFNITVSEKEESSGLQKLRERGSYQHPTNSASFKCNRELP